MAARESGLFPSPLLPVDQDSLESTGSALHELTHRVDQLETVASQLETAVYALQAAASAKPSAPQQPAPAAPAVRPSGVCREEVFAVLFGCRKLTPLQQAEALMLHRTIGPLLRGEHPAGAASAPATTAPLDPPLVPPAPAPAGVTVEELVDCLPAGLWDGPVVYNHLGFAFYLLGHPRLGPLLRGEGAPAPKRVKLLEEVPTNVLERRQSLTSLAGEAYRDGCRDTWAFARAEVERQQGQQDGGQVNG